MLVVIWDLDGAHLLVLGADMFTFLSPPVQVALATTLLAGEVTVVTRGL